MASIVTTVRRELRSYVDPRKAAFFPRFFKTGKGEYGYGDRFIGVTVPEVRIVARRYADLKEAGVVTLLHSAIHEERLLALLILVGQYTTGNHEKKERVALLYIRNIEWVNNWDLVDASADKILGAYCQMHNPEILFDYARSADMWKRRIAMVATYHYIKQGEAGLALQIATILKDDAHDLIQKAVGWMLREVGKRCGQEIEEGFLEQYAATMPRTMLRYAIERFSPSKRAYYMALRQNS